MEEPSGTSISSTKNLEEIKMIKSENEPISYSNSYSSRPSTEKMLENETEEQSQLAKLMGK